MKIEKQAADKTEIHALKQIEKESVLIDKTILRPGHKCFEINHITLECSEAKYEREVNFHNADTLKVVINSDCSYINALNKKNAIKAFNKGGRKPVKPLMKIGYYLDSSLTPRSS